MNHRLRSTKDQPQPTAELWLSTFLSPESCSFVRCGLPERSIAYRSHPEPQPALDHDDQMLTAWSWLVSNKGRNLL